MNDQLLFKRNENVVVSVFVCLPWQVFSLSGDKSGGIILNGCLAKALNTSDRRSGMIDDSSKEERWDAISVRP